MTSDEVIMLPDHPGEVVMHEYLEPLGVTQHHLAVVMGPPPQRINEIVPVSLRRLGGESNS